MTKYQKCPTCGSDVEVRGKTTMSFVPLERIDEDDLIGVLAQAYCSEENKHKELDSAILSEILKLVTQRFGKERIRVPENKDHSWECPGYDNANKIGCFEEFKCLCGADNFNAAIAEFKRLNGIE